MKTQTPQPILELGVVARSLRAVRAVACDSRTRRGLLLSTAIVLATPAMGRAQTVTVDEGTFNVSVRGSQVGTEAFTIARRGSGDASETLARGQIRMDLSEGTRTLAPLLRTVGVGMEVAQYQLKATGANEREVRLDRSGPRRLHATVVTADGEREQEFRYQPGAILLESGVAHHLYFLGSRIQAGASSVLVVLPTQRAHASAQIERVGEEAVSIAGTSVSATRYTVAVGEATRSVWYDAEWRVLRVENPSQGYVAIRRELP